MRLSARALTLAAILASLSSVASGYYHWTYFVSRSGSFVPIHAKFNLAALPNRTVSYFVSDLPPSTLVANDNYDALLSQIRRAADTWDRVGNSQLRLEFGGISTVGTPQSAPGIDVVFDDDMPPGLFAQTAVTTPSDLTYLNGADPATAAVPILRSRLQLRSDLTVFQQSSFSDTFFMTIVHEFGHTLGLQHSLASATMSTALTRGTNKSLPLSADDLAAIALLYPSAKFAKMTGSITGQVQVSGQGVNLASVVAISANGTAIGGMTNPNGTYRIDGLPPGDYYVYAQPLPSAQQGETTPAAIDAPLDPNSQPFVADTKFDTQFFPGTHSLQAATPVTVSAAAGVPDINFNLQSRPNGASIYNMQLYGFLGPDSTAPVHSPPLVIGDRRFLVFIAPGLVVPNTTNLTPGLNVTAIGGAAQMETSTLAYFTQGFVMMVVDTNAVSSPTPVALAVTTPTDLYVLPAAFSVVPTQPPTLSSVSGSTDAQGNATVTIGGSNLGTDMQFLFDGAAASGITVNSDATLTMTAPPAVGTHSAFVEVLTSDGQTSSQALATNLPPTFTYAALGNPFLTVDPPNFVAGVDTMVEIKGFNTNFIDGDTSVGFGSSDIVVRRVWVTDSGRVLLNVSVSPAAALGPVTVTVATGLQVVTLKSVVQVLAPPAHPMSLRAPVVDATNNLPGVVAGGSASFGTSGLPSNMRGWMVTIGGVNTGFLNTDDRIYAFVLGALPPGPTVVRLIQPAGVAPVAPILMQVDTPPPAILSVLGPDGTPLDDSHFVKVGDVITLDVVRLGNAARAVVTVSGIEQTFSVAPPDQNGISHIQFTLTGDFADASQQIIGVQVFSRVARPYRITLAPASAPASQ